VIARAQPDYFGSHRLLVQTGSSQGALDVLIATKASFSVAAAASQGLAWKVVKLGEPGNHTVALQLIPPVTLQGKIVNQEGMGLFGSKVAARPNDRTSIPFALLHDSPWPLGLLRAVADPKGRFVIRLPEAPLAYRLSILPRKANGSYENNLNNERTLLVGKTGEENWEAIFDVQPYRPATKKKNR